MLYAKTFLSIDMTRSLALSAFRDALRATHVAFKGDPEVLHAARLQIREGYRKHGNLKEEDARSEITKLNEVSQFLIKNIVQGSRDEKDGRYFLNFHDKTELGDNETIKQSNRANMGSLAGAKVKKCS